jgi:HEAT repeat protein
MPDKLTLAFWQRVAYTLVSEEKLSLTQPELSLLVEETLASQENVERGEAARLQKAVSKNSLFITWANGSVSFMSPVWRNFLAASFVAQNGPPDGVSHRLADPNWTDIVAFYVGQKGATELATRLLGAKEQSLTRDALFQVASWMPEATDGGEWRRQTMILLGQIIRQVSFAYALRQRAAIALVQTGEPGIFTFVSQLLERSDPFLRHLGTAALSHFGSEKAIELLAKMLEDGDSQVRKTAAYALSWIQHPMTEKPLLTALIQGDEEMSRIAAEGLAWNGSEGVEILKEAIEDDDLQVRRAAIQGLALRDEEWIAPLLVEIERNDSEWVVKAAATEALEVIRTRAKPPPWQTVPVGKQSWLVRHAAQEGRSVPKGDATLPYLVQIMTEFSGAKQRAAAASSLGQIAAWDALPALETAVRDANRQVSEAAFTTLCLLRRAYAQAPSEQPNS